MIRQPETRSSAQSASIKKMSAMALILKALGLWSVYLVAAYKYPLIAGTMIFAASMTLSVPSFKQNFGLSGFC
jgi:hypothetical protein